MDPNGQCSTLTHTELQLTAELPVAVSVPDQPRPQKDIALALLEAGIAVIPIGENKVPAIAWKRHINAGTTAGEVAEWFSSPAGIGRLCGAVSGNLETIDFDVDGEVDPTYGQDATALLTTWADLVDGHCPGLRDRLCLIKTPRPGWHVTYRCDEPVEGNQKLAYAPKVGDGWKCVIETRGEGGYALCPGSPPWCHPKGGDLYQHVSGPPLENVQTITAAERKVLLQVARTFCRKPHVEKDLPQALHSSASPTLRPGEDFESRMTWPEILEPKGFSLVQRTAEGVSYWRRPGSNSKWSASTNHSGSGLFFAFSPNCGVEPDRGYSKFAVHTFLNHGGNFAEATRVLAEKGFGKEPDRSHIDIAGVLADEIGALPKDENPFEFQSYRDFMAVIEETEYLCDGILAAGQSCILVGPEKSLKTGISIDLCYSLATGTPFLGRFPCKRAVSVGVMTGESSRPKLQRLFATRAAVDCGECQVTEPKIVITSSLPDLSATEHLAKMDAAIRLHSLEVLVIDPTYLCLGLLADHTSNVAKMGNMLRSFQAIGVATGCTLVLLHHTNRKHEDWQPLKLRDMSGAGFSEWARQWLLINPRKPFAPDTYEHCLWMGVGGSAGHAGRYAVNVRERNDQGDWAWIAEVREEGQERADYHETKRAGKEEAKREKEADFARNLTEALKASEAQGGATVNDLKKWFSENSREGVTKITKVKLEEFEIGGFAKRTEAIRGNNQTTQVWLPANSAPVAPSA